MGSKKVGVYWSEPTLNVLDSLSPPTPSPRSNNMPPARIYSYEHICDEMLTFIPDVDGTIGSLHRRQRRTANGRNATVSCATLGKKASSVESGGSVAPLSSDSTTAQQDEQGSYPSSFNVTEFQKCRQLVGEGEGTALIKKVATALFAIVSFAIESMDGFEGNALQNNNGLQESQQLEADTNRIPSDLQSLEDFVCTPGPVSLIND